jgi:hypothetical protein
MVVNVPWVNTEYGLATSSTSGIVRTWGTAADVTAETLSTTAGRFYRINSNISGQLYVNVPWVDTNTTYTAGEGLTLSGTQFRETFPVYVQTATPTTAITGTLWFDIN